MLAEDVEKVNRPVGLNIYLAICCDIPYISNYTYMVLFYTNTYYMKFDI